MRMLMTVTIPNDGGNDAVQSGRIGEIFGQFLEKWEPEAAYFGSSDGKRTAWFVVDLPSPSNMPPMAEPLFQELNAGIEVTPVMSPEDLMKGVQALG